MDGNHPPYLCVGYMLKKMKRYRPAARAVSSEKSAMDRVFPEGCLPNGITAWFVADDTRNGIAFNTTQIAGIPICRPA